MPRSHPGDPARTAGGAAGGPLPEVGAGRGVLWSTRRRTSQRGGGVRAQWPCEAPASPVPAMPERRAGLGTEGAPRQCTGTLWVPPHPRVAPSVGGAVGTLSRGRAPGSGGRRVHSMTVPLSSSLTRREPAWAWGAGRREGPPAPAHRDRADTCLSGVRVRPEPDWRDGARGGRAHGSPAAAHRHLGEGKAAAAAADRASAGHGRAGATAATPPSVPASARQPGRPCAGGRPPVSCERMLRPGRAVPTEADALGGCPLPAPAPVYPLLQATWHSSKCPPRHWTTGGAVHPW